ncbi:predicted protein [Naegleria gruberi]|uniref:Predicted protein n=1 Tax=Naegleria gruberi TaxID=5762 RepID=D2VS92_NAEGR|nr:uncharacterized protein NAEGRDRAFT_71858 [Naegleria gruberi]EFC40302.1 predicted protein [Naegleria gruberi]|eukprot:XP_002673046.1 predicted protein [Naegleria gruberi strain NEG-M]
MSLHDDHWEEIIPNNNNNTHDDKNEGWNSIPDELWIEIFSFHCDSFRSVLIDIPSISRRFCDLISPPKLDHLMMAFQKCHEQHQDLKNSSSSSDESSNGNAPTEKVSGWRKFFSFVKKKSSNNTVNDEKNVDLVSPPMENVNSNEDEVQEMIKQLEKDFKEMSLECVNTGGDLLYKRLLELQELIDFKELVLKHGSFRSAFVQSVIDGIKLNPEKCFRREMIYHASHIFKTEEDYHSFISSHEGEIEMQKHQSESCGTTILMTDDYSSSSAGINLISNPIFYDTGVKFYEFRVHKSGRYDNYLIGLCLTEVLELDSMLKKTYEQTDNLSSRFLLEEGKTYDLKYYDYFGSSNSIGWAYYNEGLSVYFNGGSNYSAPSFSSKLSYPCDYKGCEYVLGIYLDTKNMRLVFAKNGALSTHGYDLNAYFTKHPKFMQKKLALYPCLSMGHKFDAVTFETRIPLATMVTIRNLVKSVKFN